MEYALQDRIILLPSDFSSKSEFIIESNLYACIIGGAAKDQISNKQEFFNDGC